MLPISIAIIIIIESSGNPMAQNGVAKGLMQITPVVLTEYNKHHPGRVVQDYELFNVFINKTIGTWYLTKRIPQLLKHYKHPITLRNILVCYNAGIKYVPRDHYHLPRETRAYLLKYVQLASKGKHERAATKNSPKNRTRAA